MYAPKQESTSTFESHPPGAVALVCTRIIDKGTVFNQQKQKDERKVSLYFESSVLMTEGDYAGQPFLVISNFNYSMYQNSMLCKFIEAWRGIPFASQEEADVFDLETLLRVPVFANIVFNDPWTNMVSPMPIPAGITPPAPVGAVYTFDADNMDMTVFEQLSDRMKENIQKSSEWANKDSKIHNQVKQTAQQATQSPAQPAAQPVDERNPPPMAVNPDNFDDDIPV